MSVSLLSPDQAEFVEAVARRVVALLDERQASASPRLVDAGELAQLLGVSRSTVYDHAAELGALEVGTGGRPRLRFDVDQARAAWGRRVSSNESHPPEVATLTGARRRRRRGAAQSGDGLLPIGPLRSVTEAEAS